MARARATSEHIDNVENPTAYAQAGHDVHALRTALLAHFLKAREYERAAVLAEKYVDFNALLTVCDERNVIHRQ